MAAGDALWHAAGLTAREGDAVRLKGIDAPVPVLRVTLGREPAAGWRALVAATKSAVK